jgi:4-hydroxybenzoate polyprenyltransferase
VHSSSESVNLAHERKAARLVDLYGVGGFDYAGNDRADIPVFEKARAALVVAPDATAHRYQVRTSARRFDATRPGLKTYVKMLRVHQGLKNLLVFAPAILAHEMSNPRVLGASFGAFIAFCAAASSIYIINDILDLPLDRRHASKRNRPFATGTLSIPFGLAVSAGMMAIAVITCFFLPPAFAAVIALYAVVTTAYSIAIKRMLLVDVLCLAGLYSLRIIGGKAAADLPPSFWLLAFSMFFFLSLALVKRYVELRTATTSERDRIAGRGYRPEDVSIVGTAGVASAFTATLVLSLYIQSQEIIGYYSSPWLIWPLVPIVLYISIRIWILAYRHEMHDDPVIFIATDWRSQLFVAIGVLLMIAGSFG